MPKFTYIYLLIALAPIALVVFVVYRNISSKSIDSPISFSNISNRVEEIMNPISVEEPSEETLAGTIKIGDTKDPKAMGYTGQDKVAVNSEGEVFVAYRAEGEDDYEIFVSKIKDGKLESAKQITDSGDKTQRVPSIAIDSSDVIHVTWYGLTSNEEEGRQVKYTKSTDNGKTWSDPVIPSLVEGWKEDDYWQEHPQILVEGNNLYIVWEGKDGDNEEQQVKFTKSSDGGKTWTKWKNVKGNPDNTQSRPYLVLDSNNNLNLFMYSSRESDSQQIWHSVSSDKGETWSEWKKVSEGLGDSRHASAAVSNGKIFLVWRSESNDKSQIYFSTYSGSWVKPELISQSSDYQFFPVVGVNKSNDVAVTWVENSDESEFPRDDPENAKGYFAFFNSSTNKFENKTLIGDSVYYPHIPVKNNFDNNFYVAYEQGQDKKFEIKLLTTNKK